jgi:hypothetical protein
MTRIENEAHRLQRAVDGVYDAHDTPPDHRVDIDSYYGTPYGSLGRAKIVADTHVYHNGDWALGSCDAELFALEWEIFLAELPEPKTTWRDRLRALRVAFAPQEARS